MSEDWQITIREATDELKKISAADAEENAPLKHNITRAESILDDVIAPALEDLKMELEKNGTPATTERGKTDLSSPSHGYYGSIIVNLDAFLSGFQSGSGTDSSETEPSSESAFFYAFSVEAEPHDLAYDNEFYIMDRGNKIEIIAEDYEELPDTAETPTREDIKQDFARKYAYTVSEVKKQRILPSSF